MIIRMNVKSNNQNHQEKSIKKVIERYRSTIRGKCSFVENLSKSNDDGSRTMSLLVNISHSQYNECEQYNFKILLKLKDLLTIKNDETNMFLGLI